MSRPSPVVAPEIAAAVERLICRSGADIAVIAVMAGLSRQRVNDWTRAGGWARTKPVRKRSEDDILADLAALERRAGAFPADTPPGATLDAADLPALRARLRLHVGRQIAAFDAALRGEGAAVIDSARVLRDLGGLKRLLDDLAAGTGEADGTRGTADRPGLDLPALRAELARRYARLPRERPDGSLPGEPAGPAAPGAGA
ncbi:hypothetical protein [uncultured Methylobacterium sp.]|uniref:hypothetical protein n=1 Tax=uncultured Methylobacterium sp. TaxID=157278 RepID=UPI0035CBDCA4